MGRFADLRSSARLLGHFRTFFHLEEVVNSCFRACEMFCDRSFGQTVMMKGHHLDLLKLCKGGTAVHFGTVPGSGGVWSS